MKKTMKYAVRYNLSGLQKPVRLQYSSMDQGYWHGEDAFFSEKSLDTPDRVDRLFPTRKEAYYYYDAVNSYRIFVRNHM